MTPLVSILVLILIGGGVLGGLGMLLGPCVYWLFHLELSEEDIEKIFGEGWSLTSTIWCVAFLVVALCVGIFWIIKIISSAVSCLGGSCG